MFKRIGDCCGGFVAVDEHTAFMARLEWARIQVNSGEQALPSSL